MIKPMTRPALILVAALALTACAAPDVNRSAVNFSESQLTVDLNFCRGGSIAETSLKTIGKGAVGSLAGAGIDALHGAGAAFKRKKAMTLEKDIFSSLISGN